MNLQQRVYRLIREQLAVWDEVRNNYANLKAIQQREFVFEHTRVVVQYNPTRIRSTAAKIDEVSVANRKCFLCLEHQPKEEMALLDGNYVIQLNPYPIFDSHLVIAHKQHIVQDVTNHLYELLSFAKQLPDFAIFFNGIGCGASAPDHLHFQAAPRGFFPILSEYAPHRCATLLSSEDCKVYKVERLERSLYVLASAHEEALVKQFTELVSSLFGTETPMFNLLCICSEREWQLLLFPRSKSRPWQYSAEREEERLLVSPGTAEMSGVFVVPCEEHFRRITGADVLDIFRQVSR